MLKCKLKDGIKTEMMLCADSCRSGGNFMQYILGNQNYTPFKKIIESMVSIVWSFAVKQISEY